MSLEPVGRPTLSAEVIAQLRGKIAAGEWPLGSRIPPEPELMQQLRVARGTLREAIRALAHGGLLEVRRGDGTFVRATSELSAAIQRQYEDHAADDLLEVRGALDLQAARLAAARATDAELEALDAILLRRATAWSARDRDGWIAADWDFHLNVAAAAHNPLLVDLYRNLADPLRTVMNTDWDVPGFDGGASGGHEALVRALRDHDPVAAAREAGENVAATQDWRHAT